MSEDQNGLQEELTKIEQNVIVFEAVYGMMTEASITTDLEVLMAEQTSLRASFEGLIPITETSSLAAGAGINVGEKADRPLLSLRTSLGDNIGRYTYE